MVAQGDMFGPAQRSALDRANRLAAPQDPVGALRRLTARYTPAQNAAFAVLDPVAWRAALAEYHALAAIRARGGKLRFPDNVVLAHLHNLELFHEGIDRRTGGPIVPLYLLDYATRTARALPHPGLHRAA